MTKTNDEYLEEDRTKLYKKFRALYGRGKKAEGGYAKNFGPGSFGVHELLHTAYLQQEIWEHYVQESGTCVRDARLYAIADNISVMMRKFYEAVAQYDDTKDAFYE